jgi:hypothetical protein
MNLLGTFQPRLVAIPSIVLLSNGHFPKDEVEQQQLMHFKNKVFIITDTGWRPPQCIDIAPKKDGTKGKFNLPADNTSLKAVGVSSPWMRVVSPRESFFPYSRLPRVVLPSFGKLKLPLVPSQDYVLQDNKRCYDKILSDWNFRLPSLGFKCILAIPSIVLLSNGPELALQTQYRE